MGLEKEEPSSSHIIEDLRIPTGFSKAGGKNAAILLLYLASPPI
jgi:hypothetical protein